jgi:signal transduction histidine kinase
MPDIDHRCVTGKDSLSQELERRLEKIKITFEALFRLFEKIGTTFDLDTIIRLLLMTIVGQLGLRRIAFFLRLEKSDRLELYHSIGLGSSAVIPAFQVDMRFIECLTGGDSIVILEDFLKSSGNVQDEDRAAVKELAEEGFSYACGLSESDQLVGMMVFSNRVNGDGFTEFERELLIMMSKIAAITIRNAFLYQSVIKSRSELENFSRMKKEFINHTSHELRTPLTVLRSSLWSVEAEGDDAVLMEMARESVLRLEEKVEMILSLNDLDVNNDFIEPAVVEISSLVVSACREFSEELKNKEIIFNICNGIGERHISVDPSRIRMAILSILDNAVSAVDCKGSVDVKLTESLSAPDESSGIEITAWERGHEHLPDIPGEKDVVSWVVIRVLDDGRGIPENEIADIGKPFQRASNSVDGDVKGLGVGLSLAHKIVAAHGGHIYCRSTEGEGAEFSVWIPDR